MKKGFTLVELLAVIAVLAIIALIAVPLIVSLIHESKRKAAILSGEQYIKAVNYKIAQEEINGNPIPDGEYIIGEDEIEVDTKNGNNITGGYLIGESEVTWAGLCVNKFSVGYFDGNAFIENGVNYCADDASAFVEPPGILMNLICEDPNLYNTENRFKIKSAEDLACFSNTVNEGKNFSGKEIYLLSDLDLSLTSSYTSYTTKKYGDINGNGTVEALFTEFNTGAGFRPIGTSGKPFAGTFLGYGFSISNLKINRTTQYVGLFGYNTGIIRGMNLYGVNISSSNQDVGGVVGYNTGTIQSIYVDGSVSGSNDAGGIVGETASNSVIKDVVSSVNVGGGNGLGGIIGRGYSVTGSSALVGGSVVSSNGGYVGYISGLQYNSSYPGIVLSTITKTGGSYNQNNGTGVSTISILGLDGFIDTIVGGDNDEDGYYIDYDNGKYKIFSTARKPIKKLKQPGTQQNPYLIRNASDWKKVASRNLDGKYIKITADIDFKNEMFYPLGTTTNPFKGHLIGDMHTLSNITLHGYNNVGIIGYNQGTIEGLNLSRITVSSSAQNITIGGVGGLVGYNTGTIKGLNLYNINITTNTNDVGGAVGYNTGTIQSVYAETTVSGANDVGGVVGEAATNSIIKDVVANATVTGGSGLGGIIGRANKVSGGAALVGGSVLPNTSGYAAYISGLQYNSSYPGIALSTISKRSDFTYDQNNGTVLNEIGIFGLDYYIDTIV